MPYNHRDAFITGLYELADFLEANPDIPAPTRGAVHHFPLSGTDDEQRAAIDQIAARLGAPVDEDDTPYGHYATSRFFGPIEYRAVAIPGTSRARHAADASYYGCVLPDPDPDA
ncbi:hypothetical protein ABT294_21105 [Nonomuraea sp. NPDC000554]|uniref:hypothetical protein n=1 Tax=Nonomuraea sp. NPDC000554 TaxID=3154259 RepID=UPI00332B82E5